MFVLKWSKTQNSVHWSRAEPILLTRSTNLNQTQWCCCGCEPQPLSHPGIPSSAHFVAASIRVDCIVWAAGTRPTTDIKSSNWRSCGAFCDLFCPLQRQRGTDRRSLRTDYCSQGIDRFRIKSSRTTDLVVSKIKILFGHLNVKVKVWRTAYCKITV